MKEVLLESFGTLRLAELLQPDSEAKLFANCDLLAVRECAEVCGASPPTTFVEASGEAVALPGMQVWLLLASPRDLYRQPPRNEPRVRGRFSRDH